MNTNNVITTVVLPINKYNEMVETGRRLRCSIGVDENGYVSLTIYNRTDRHRKPSTIKRLKYGKVAVSNSDVRLSFRCTRGDADSVGQALVNTAFDAAEFVDNITIIDNI